MMDYYLWIYYSIPMPRLVSESKWDGCVISEEGCITSIRWVRGERTYLNHRDSIELHWNCETHTYECKLGNIPSDVNIVHERHPCRRWHLPDSANRISHQVWDQYLNTLNQEHTPKPAP